jgi:ribosomal protein S18 acetylase RimI-like enzyme
MIITTLATVYEIGIIQSIAHQTWPSAFASILSPQQVDYMLEMIYSTDALTEQMEMKGHHFYIAREGSENLGFISYEINYEQSSSTKIHKLYILPSAQGKGIGQLLIDIAITDAKHNHNNQMTLNVNRFNKALLFYQKLGFKIIETENISIGNGYLMEDYKMNLIL